MARPRNPSSTGRCPRRLGRGLALAGAGTPDVAAPRGCHGRGCAYALTSDHRTVEECAPNMIAGNRGFCNLNPWPGLFPVVPYKHQKKAIHAILTSAGEHFFLMLHL